MHTAMQPPGIRLWSYSGDKPAVCFFVTGGFVFSERQRWMAEPDTRLRDLYRFIFKRLLLELRTNCPPSLQKQTAYKLYIPCNNIVFLLGYTWAWTWTCCQISNAFNLVWFILTSYRPILHAVPPGSTNKSDVMQEHWTTGSIFGMNDWKLPFGRYLPIWGDYRRNRILGSWSPYTSCVARVFAGRRQAVQAAGPAQWGGQQLASSQRLASFSPFALHNEVVSN